MLPNAPTLGEPQPNFFITSRVVGIPTLAHKDPENPPNCVLDGFITKAPPVQRLFGMSYLCLFANKCSYAIN